MKSIIVYALIVFSIILPVEVFAYLTHFTKELTGVIEILALNLASALLLHLFGYFKDLRFRYILIVLITVNLAILFNATGFSASSMQSSSYYVPRFQNATNILITVTMFSAFLLFIPTIIHGAFIFSLAKIVYWVKKKDMKG